MTASRHSFRKAAESWLSESAGSVSEKTIEHYRWVLERFVFPNIEGSLEITGEEVEKLVEGTRKEGLSESTLYEIPRVIWKVLSFAAGPREGLYRLIETLLGDDRDGKMLVEYLRSNMRVSEMPSRGEFTAQTIRRRVVRGFEKLCARLEEA